MLNEQADNQRVAARPRQPAQLVPEPHMEPRTRAGFERIMMGGTPEQLDQAAMSLLRSGYPVAAQICVNKAGGMRRFDIERRALLARQAQQQSAQAAAGAQAQAISGAAATMQALAAQKPATENVQPTAGPGTVILVPPPVAVPVAPPIGVATGEALSSAPTKPVKQARKAAPRAPKKKSANGARPAASGVTAPGAPHVPAVQQVNGRVVPQA